MANEITVIGRVPRTGKYRLFFRYDLTAPVQVGGTNVVPTPATQRPSADNPTPTAGDALPPVVQAALTAQEFADLDAGDAAFEIVTFHPDEGLTNPQLLARARQVYAARKAAYEAEYALRYQNAGLRFDEVP